MLTLLLIAACVVFAWSGYRLIVRQKEYADARAEYDALREAFTGDSSAADGAADSSESSGTADAGDASGTDGASTANGASAQTGAALNVDFDGLRAVNQDVVGWVEIPGTGISYPIAQADDNRIYLDTGFDGSPSSSGAIFADCDCQADLMGAHTIIYGHHMRDGSMFAGLVDYKNADFFNSHPEILLATPERQLRLTVIAAYAVSADAPLRRFEFGEGEFEAFLAECLARSELARADIDLSQVDRLYSFVTCSYEADDMRTVVHAVELG